MLYLHRGGVKKAVVQGTLIYSRIADGRWIYSTDNTVMFEIDVTRSWLSQIVFKADFAELLAAHRRRLDQMTPNVIPLETDREIASFRAARDEHWQLFAERRLSDRTQFLADRIKAARV